MPGACAVDLREALLSRIEAATRDAASRQDAVLAAELAAWEAAGGLTAPGDPYEAAPDLEWGPPDGADAWLADLPAELLAEYLTATQDPPGPEPIVAGRLLRQPGDGCGFAAGGMADDLAPGAVLAGLAGDVWDAGLGRLSDDELIGVLGAARRLASWSAALELAAVADLARRRTAGADTAGDGTSNDGIAGDSTSNDGTSNDGTSNEGTAGNSTAGNSTAGDSTAGEHIADEIAAALTLTGRAADALLDLALALRRLPATMAALAAGRIDRSRAAVIADEVAGLGDEHTAAVEDRVLRDAPGQTTGQLRAATRRAVLTADPAAARERKERAQRDARVEKWDEHAGTAALAGRDLPPAEALAADQHLSALARSLKRAGVSGTMDQLRARVYLTLLTGQSTTTLLPSGRFVSTGGSGTSARPALPCDHGPVGSVNLTLPLATWLGLSDGPGEAAGYGPLNAADARDLAALLDRQPGSRWCITLTGERGQPIAHGCARDSPTRACARSSPAHGRARPPPHAGPSPGPSTAALGWLTGIKISKLETRDCRHLRESPTYRPSPTLRHLIIIRQPACSFPGCRRPAVRCDEDHTVPYDQGGRTCECNLAPLCRRHHRAKQARGWRLIQPQPGVMAWTIPSGRTYATGPATYPG